MTITGNHIAFHQFPSSLEVFIKLSRIKCASVCVWIKLDNSYKYLYVLQNHYKLTKLMIQLGQRYLEIQGSLV